MRLVGVGALLGHKPAQDLGDVLRFPHREVISQRAGDVLRPVRGLEQRPLGRGRLKGSWSGLD